MQPFLQGTVRPKIIIRRSPRNRGLFPDESEGDNIERWSRRQGVPSLGRRTLVDMYPCLDKA